MSRSYPSRLIINKLVTSNMATKSIRVAAVQAEPEWNHLQKGVEKTIRLIKEAGENGTNVMGFPEVWIPGYPWYVVKFGVQSTNPL